MPRLPDLDAWAMFAKVAETGSFARAAADLNVGKATISKAVSRLEARIGSALLHRTSRRLSLTETGRRAAAGAARILAEGEAIEAEASACAATPRGRVRLAAPMSFGVMHVAPLLPALMAAFPGLEMELHLADELVDLVGGGYDLALRIGVLTDSSLRARRICRVRRLLVGAPAYFARHGMPAHPRDLAAHACLSYLNAAAPGRWLFRNDAGAEEAVPVSGPLRANNGDAMLPALRAGLGLAILPDFIVWDDLASGRLSAAMPGWSMSEIGLHLVTPPGGRRPARVEAVMGFLSDALGRAAWATRG